MTLTVHSAECSSVSDGRRKHVFTKVDGQFVCLNCGSISDPANRWGRRSNQRVG